MDRRSFLEKCAGGALVALVGCVDGAVPTGRGSVRVLEDDGGMPEGDAGGGSGDPPDGGPTPFDAGSGRSDAGGGPPRDAGPAPTDAGGCTDADHVVMYDVHAQALYFDGSHGPTTGIIRVDWVIEGDAVELEFWHGHGGVSHRFTVSPEHFEALKRGERVTLETTEVDSHSHELFIDPVDPAYRVDGASPVRVPLC